MNERWPADWHERSQATIVLALQACARAFRQDYLTMSQYAKWRKQEIVEHPETTPRPPGRTTILQHFDDFAAALKAAGLQTWHEHERTRRLAYSVEPTGLGIEESLVVSYALSMFLTRFSGERRYLAVFCRLVGEISGVVGPQPSGGWPDGKSVLRWLGLRPADLDAECTMAAAANRPLATGTLTAFAAPRLWGPLYSVIDAGPVDLCERAFALLRAWASGTELDGTARRALGSNKPTLEHGGLSEGTIDNHISALYGFMYSLDELRILEDNDRIDLKGHHFTKWNRHHFLERPSAAEFGASPANTNRDAPTLRLIRLVLQDLCYEIDTLKQTARGRRRLFQPLRDRAIIATLVVTGLRRGAFNRLHIGDVAERHAFPGGETGPAIVPRPGKSLSKYLKRPKGIPAFVADWIIEYAKYAGIWDYSEAPLWLPNRAGRRVRHEPLGDESITSIVKARFTPTRYEKRGRRPASPLAAALLEEHDGRVYGPHQLRHAAEQIGFMVGLDWLEENRRILLQNGGGRPSNPQVFPDALLDHSMSSLGDRYKDVASERGRLRWARECALGIGSYVHGPKGARKGPDVDLIRQRTDKLNHAAARQSELETQLAAVEARVINGGHALEQTEILVAVVQIMHLARRLTTAGEAVERARNELAEAREREIPAPDHLTSAELVALQEMIDAPSGMADVPLAMAAEEFEDEEIPILRDWAWLHEFHWALGGQAAISIETLRRWARGESTTIGRALGLITRRDGRPPTCVERVSARKQRILLTKLDWSRLPQEVQENLEALRCMPDL